MDWGYKAVLTAMTVAAVLMVAHLFGRRLAGLLAGLPVTAAPTLLWLAAEHGEAYAARCAIGSICACGAAAVFALAYERLGRWRGPLSSLGGALVAGGVVALALATEALTVAGALAAATLLCGAALLWLPASSPRAGGARRLRSELVLTAVIAGIVSATVAVLSPQLGEFWSGLLASLPIISASVLVYQHLTTSHADRQRFLRGYASGLIGKVGFAATFAAAAPLLGAVLSMGAATAIGLTIAALSIEAGRRVEARHALRIGRQA